MQEWVGEMSAILNPDREANDRDRRALERNSQPGEGWPIRGRRMPGVPTARGWPLKDSGTGAGGVGLTRRGRGHWRWDGHSYSTDKTELLSVPFEHDLPPISPSANPRRGVRQWLHRFVWHTENPLSHLHCQARQSFLWQSVHELFIVVKRKWWSKIRNDDEKRQSTYDIVKKIFFANLTIERLTRLMEIDDDAMSWCECSIRSRQVLWNMMSGIW
jgi:hypothetical protein